MENMNKEEIKKIVKEMVDAMVDVNQGYCDDSAKDYECYRYYKIKIESLKEFEKSFNSLIDKRMKE